MILLAYTIIPKLKANYNAVHNLRTASGFGWDEGTKMVVTTDAAWAAYIKVWHSRYPFLPMINSMRPPVGPQESEALEKYLLSSL